jgi:chromosome segregation ATPase
MTATVAEMKIEQLRKELADAEAKLTTAKTLDSEFVETTKNVNRTQQFLNLTDQRLRKAISGAESLAQEAATIPYIFQEKRDAKVNELRNQRTAVRDLEVNLNEAEAELRSARAAHETIKTKIAQHPEYASVRDKQRKLVAEATKLARSLFSVSLDELGGVLKNVSQVANAERNLIESTSRALREDGLPEIRMLLANFVTMVTPQFADQISVARTETYKQAEQVEEVATRPVLA